MEKEDLLNDKIKQLHVAAEQATEKEAHIERLKKEVEKVNRRLTEMEQRNDELDIKKRSIEKQQQVQNKQLIEKIKNLMDAISQEKDTRELWIGRYEREQKTHMATSNELLTVKGQMQDLQLKVKQRELEVESVAKARDLHKHNNEKLTSQLTELMAKKESAERDLFSKSELLRTIEEHHMIYIRKL